MDAILSFEMGVIGMRMVRERARFFNGTGDGRRSRRLMTVAPCRLYDSIAL